MEDLLDIIIPIVITLLLAAGGKLLESIKKRFGQKDSANIPASPPPPPEVSGPAEGSSWAPQPVSAKSYGFTPEEEGRGWSATEKIAASEASEAGMLAKEQDASAQQEGASLTDAYQHRLAAHRRRWRRAMIDSIVLRRP